MANVARSEFLRDDTIDPGAQERFNEFVSRHRTSDSRQLRTRRNDVPNSLVHFSRDITINAFRFLIGYAIERDLPIKHISGALNPEFYHHESLISGAQNIIDSGLPYDLIVYLNIDELKTNKYFNIVKNNDNIIHISTECDSYFHFFLVGTQAFRLDRDHRTGEAVVSFDDRHTGGYLDLYFDTRKNSAIQQL